MYIQVRKVGVRDLSFVVSQCAHGATTVSATMHIAHLAGIKVCMCMFTCMCVCMYVCMYVHMVLLKCQQPCI